MPRSGRGPTPSVRQPSHAAAERRTGTEKRGRGFGGNQTVSPKSPRQRGRRTPLPLGPLRSSGRAAKPGRPEREPQPRTRGTAASERGAGAAAAAAMDGRRSRRGGKTQLLRYSAKDRLSRRCPASWAKIGRARMDAGPSRDRRCPLRVLSRGREIRVFAPLRGHFCASAVRVFALFPAHASRRYMCSVFLRFVVVKSILAGGFASRATHKMLRFFPPSASILPAVSLLYTASSVQNLVF